AITGPAEAAKKTAKPKHRATGKPTSRYTAPQAAPVFTPGPDAGPPNDAGAVLSPPLRNVHPLPPPNPGEDHRDRERFEPIRPPLPPETGLPDTSRQIEFGGE